MKRHDEILLFLLFSIAYIKPFTLFAVPIYSNNIQVIAIDSLGNEYSYLKSINTVKCILWKDKIGINYLGIEHICKGKIGEKGYESKISAYTLTKSQNENWKQLWRINDFGENEVSNVGYLDNTLIISDIDNDSIAETCFMYAKFHDCCDAWVTKLMFHWRGQKFAIRGEVPITEEDIESYKKKIDPAFNKCNKEIVKFASEQWDEGIRKNWKNILSHAAIEKMLSLYSCSTKSKVRNQYPPPKKK